MKVEQKILTDFAVLGRKGVQYDTTPATWIQTLWFDFEQHVSELESVVTFSLAEDELDCWGLSSSPFADIGTPQEYLAGIQVPKGAVAPPGWTYWEVPDREYVVVKTNVLLIDQTVTYLFEDYFPKAGIELIDAIQEFYAAEDTPGELWLYCPIAAC